MPNEPFQPARGTRDISGEELSARMKIADMLSRVVESYGFKPLETPAFENFDFLAKKSGPEIKGQIYYFKDKSERELGLRFDLTVPVVRFVLGNPAMAKPIRLYSLGKVWRYEDVSAGRFREFTQLDVEILGSDKVLVDAETIACAISCLKVFGLPKILVKVNVREIIEGFARSIGVTEQGQKDALFRAIDKREKLSEPDFRKELEGVVRLGEREIDQTVEFCALAGDAGKTLAKAEKVLNQNALVAEGMAKLHELFLLLRAYGVADSCEVDFSIARGIAYYTGIIFEVRAGSYGLSVIGGGRYDKLIGLYCGDDMPATGFGLGIDRLYEVLEKEKLLPAANAGSKALIIPISQTELPAAIDVLKRVREAGVPAEMDVMGRGIGKNLEFADKGGIAFSVIVGPKELADGLVKVKDMESGEEKLVKTQEAPFYLAGVLNERNLNAGDGKKTGETAES